MQLIDDKKKNCVDVSSFRKSGASAASRKILRTMWDHIHDILRSDGLTGLYRGLGGTLLREV